MKRRVEIYTVRTGDKSGATTQRIYRGTPDEYLDLLDWAPSGDYLLVRSTSISNPNFEMISKVPLDGSPIVHLMPAHGIGNVDISPDGSRFVFSWHWIVGSGHDRKWVSDIYSSSSDGVSDYKRLTTDNLSSRPVFTPDGQSIIYYRDHNIDKMDADGGNSTDIPNLRQIPVDKLAVSPDGSSVAWSQAYVSNGGIHTATLSGSNIRRISPAVFGAEFFDVEWGN